MNSRVVVNKQCFGRNHAKIARISLNQQEHRPVKYTDQCQKGFVTG